MSAVARNLGLLMRGLLGIGTARGLQSPGGLAGAIRFALLNVLVIGWPPRIVLSPSAARRTNQRQPNHARAIAA